MLYFRLAWRNIWRNKRRTLITTFSIVLAVLLSSVTRSMQIGSYDQMIENVAGKLTGYIQLHQDGYWEKPTLNRSFASSDTLIQHIEQTEGVETVVPRIQSYMLAAGRDKSRAALVMGIDIEKEKALSNPHKNLIEGSYFQSNSQRGVLISEGLASYLSISVGDTLVLLGQGYHGVSAAEGLPVTGIAEYGVPDLNRALAFVPLQTAQYMYGATGRLTAASVIVDNPRSVGEITQRIRAHTSGDYEVMPWQELMPELVQAIEADNSGGVIMLLVLYMVVGFGIIGTILMMTAERKFELGVMVAIGTKRIKVALMLIIELIYLALLGALTGIVLSIPVIYYFHLNPIRFSGDVAHIMQEFGMEPVMPFSTDPVILLNQAAVVLGICAVISLYPILHAYRINPIKAIQT